MGFPKGVQETGFPSVFGNHQDHLEEFIRRRVQNHRNGDVEITGIGLSSVESKSIRGVPKNSEMEKKHIRMLMERRA
ncbi:unnamed protein product [Caenorhabditis nigoni]